MSASFDSKTIRFNDVNLGPDLIIDGGFDDPSKWDVSEGSWEITGSKAHRAAWGTTIMYPIVNPPVGAEMGKTYRITGIISGIYNGGSVRISIAQHYDAFIWDTDGFHTGDITVTIGGDDCTILVKGYNFFGDFDNLTMQEIL